MSARQDGSRTLRVPGRVVRGLTATVVAGALATGVAACSPREAGAAAVVGDRRITTAQLDEAVEGDTADVDAAVRLRDEGEHDGAEVAVRHEDLGAVGQRRGHDRDDRRRLRPGGDPRRVDADDAGEERSPLLDERAVPGR